MRISTTYNNIHFIVNPSSGVNPPPYDVIGQYMAQSPSKTTVHMTKLNHSASACVQDALDAGADLVIAYGGDGTMMEVATCLHDHEIPMAILPGGTANIVAHELNIPLNTQQALDLIFNMEHEKRWLDAGLVGDKYFLLRFSLGWEAELSQRPSTEDKSSWGTLAYTSAALSALQELDPVTYQITLDDDRVETVTGINCSVCNIGSVGMYGLSIGLDITPDDGLLNVLILQNKNVQAILDITQNVLASSLPLDLEERLIHYKAKKMKIAPSEPQLMSYDGEAFDADLPLTIECVPRFVSILTPKII